MFGDDAQDLDAVDETLVFVELNDQPFFVVVEKRLMSVIVENHLGRRRKLQRTTCINLKQTIIQISPVWGLTVDSSQSTLVPTSKSRDTKSRPNIKNPARLNLDIVP